MVKKKLEENLEEGFDMTEAPEIEQEVAVVEEFLKNKINF